MNASNEQQISQLYSKKKKKKKKRAKRANLKTSNAKNVRGADEFCALRTSKEYNTIVASLSINQRLNIK